MNSSSQENAAVYSFTAQIDDRLITAVLKEKKVAETEYGKAVQRGQTAVLLRQSKQTLDTFTVSSYRFSERRQRIEVYILKLHDMR